MGESELSGPGLPRVDDEHGGQPDSAVAGGRRKSSVQSPLSSDRSGSVRSGYSLARSVNEKRARRVRFYRNGDRFFKGMVYAVSTERFRTFESLLNALTSSSLCDRRVLPQGVRHIFSVAGSRRVDSLDELQEGQSYVCASTDVFRSLDYAKNEDPDWNAHMFPHHVREAHHLQQHHHQNQKQQPQQSEVGDGSTRTRSQNHMSSSRSRHRPVSADENSRALKAKSEIASAQKKSYEDYQRSFVLPRLITLIKHGKRPRKAVRLLLNKKTAQTYEQVLEDLAEAVKLNCGNIKKLYTLSGRRVTCLADFFQDETIFLACGHERLSPEDLHLDKAEVRQVSAYRPSNGTVRERVMLKKPFASSTSSVAKSTDHSTTTTTNTTAPSLASVRDTPGKGKRQPAEPATPRAQSGHSGKTTDRLQDVAKTDMPVALTNKYEVGALLGTGNFAVVLECRDRRTNRKYALKLINKESYKGQERVIDEEVRILRRVKHPNIIRLVEDFSNQHRFFYIMELVKGGDLFDALVTSNVYTEMDAGGMLFNLASALQYLHGLSIVHRDVKPENILIRQHDDGSKSLKLGDFGLATEIKGLLYTVCGTPTYVAPEVIAETGYGVKIDVWSAGVITYILLCGFPPFSSPTENQDDLFDLILSASYDFPSPYWDGVSDSAKSVITRMLDMDPHSRLSASQLLEHSWVASETVYKADLQKTVSKGLGTYFRRSTKQSPRNPGVQIMAATALDKASKFFMGRGSPSDRARGAE